MVTEQQCRNCGAYVTTASCLVCGLLQVPVYGTSLPEQLRKSHEDIADGVNKLVSELPRFVPKIVSNVPKPQPELVASLERLLERAKSGELQAFAYAIVITDGPEPDSAINSGLHVAPRTWFALAAAINSRLVPEFNQAFREVSEGP